MHGGLCRGILGLNRRSSYVSKLRSQPLFAALPSRRWLSSPEMTCASGRRDSARTFSTCGIPRSRCICGERLRAGGGVKVPMGKTSWTHLIAIPTAVAGRGGAYGGAAVLKCADARPPSLPRC